MVRYVVGNIAISFTLQEPKKLNSTVRNQESPRILSCKDQVLFVVGGEILDKLPKPSTLNGWGKVMLTYFSIFYVFRLPYPQGLQTALLVIQKMKIDEDISTQDWGKARCESKMKSFLDFTEN